MPNIETPLFMCLVKHGVIADRFGEVPFGLDNDILRPLDGWYVGGIKEVDEPILGVTHIGPGKTKEEALQAWRDVPERMRVDRNDPEWRETFEEWLTVA